MQLQLFFSILVFVWLVGTGSQLERKVTAREERLQTKNNPFLRHSIVNQLKPQSGKLIERLEKRRV